MTVCSDVIFCFIQYLKVVCDSIQVLPVLVSKLSLCEEGQHFCFHSCIHFRLVCFLGFWWHTFLLQFLIGLWNCDVLLEFTTFPNIVLYTNFTIQTMHLERKIIYVHRLLNRKHKKTTNPLAFSSIVFSLNWIIIGSKTAVGFIWIFHWLPLRYWIHSKED